MNKESPPINQGTDSPPAKKVLMVFPFLENSMPKPNTNTEKMTMTAVSK
jgi:hypothetical protein